MKFKFILNEADQTVQPKSKAELKKIIDETIKAQGPNCDLNFIDTSLITDMSELFKGSKFNGDISKWNVSNVTNMAFMFSGCEQLEDISALANWNVSNVWNMDCMFQEKQCIQGIVAFDYSVSYISVQRNNVQVCAADCFCGYFCTVPYCYII